MLCFQNGLYHFILQPPGLRLQATFKRSALLPQKSTMFHTTQAALTSGRHETKREMAAWYPAPPLPRYPPQSQVHPVTVTRKKTPKHHQASTFPMTRSYRCTGQGPTPESSLLGAPAEHPSVEFWKKTPTGRLPTLEQSQNSCSCPPPTPADPPQEPRRAQSIER